jgi:dipeptidyl aminopeptidase/acylaminoacyl peptidase
VIGAVAGAVLGGLVPGMSRAQTTAPRALAPEALFAARSLRYGARVSLSLDGRYVAYVAENPGEHERDGDIVQTRNGWSLRPSGAPSHAGQVWVLDLHTGRETAVLGTAGHSWAPTWSPTAPVLALLSDRDGQAGLWLWRPADRATPRRISAVPVSGAYDGAVRWTTDGRHVLLASPPRADLAEAARGRGAPAGKAVEVRRAGFADSGATHAGTPAPKSTLPEPPFDIVSADIRTGAVTPLAHDVGIDWLEPSPDGRLLAYATMRDYSRPEGQQYQAYYALHVMPLSGGATRVLASHLPLTFIGGKEVVHWAPDSRSLAYATMGLAAQHGLFRVAVDGSGVVPLEPFTPFMDLSVGQAQGVVWDSAGTTLYGWSGPVVWRYDATTGRGQELARLAGKHIWHVLTRAPFNQLYTHGADIVAVAVADSGTTSGFYGVDVASGRVTPLYQVSKQIGAQGGFSAENTTAVAPRGDGIVFTQESAAEPPELWHADPGFREVRRVSHLSGMALDVRMGERRVVEWTMPTGEQRRGILLLPPDYQPGTRYPLIVWLYERSVPYYVNTFGLAGQQVFNLQLFATRGYAAFYPDLRWAPESVMTSLGEQVHSGVEELARLGIVDSARVGVVGQSSGGYDVLAIAATCPWVRAGVAVSGIADMVMAFGGTMDDPVGYDWVEKQMGLGAPPWAHPERYVANSPSYHFDQVQARLLLLEGTADTFTLGHMDLAYAELKRLGKPVEYRRYQGEGHVPDMWTSANRLDAARRMLEWFDTYVKAAQ